jgi:uncharacterized protein with PIN domain
MVIDTSALVAMLNDEPEAERFEAAVEADPALLMSRYHQDCASLEADRLARELAARTGATLTDAVVIALRERLARQTGLGRVVSCRS